MKPLHFSVAIHAPKTRVHQLMLADRTYREWTSAFAEGSCYQGSWDKGAHRRTSPCRIFIHRNAVRGQRRRARDKTAMARRIRELHLYRGEWHHYRAGGHHRHAR